jgi:hypothetical protein
MAHPNDRLFSAKFISCFTALGHFVVCAAGLSRYVLWQLKYARRAMGASG